MSTPPKDPKPGAGNALESTFLGVAPLAPEPPPPSSAPAGSGSSGGSAIVAAPMISVSGDRKPRQPAAAPAPAAPAHPAAPAYPAALQGGWQSAGVAGPQSPDQTAPHGTPGVWAPPPAQEAAGLQTQVGRAAPPQPPSAPPPYPAAQPYPPPPAQPPPAAGAAGDGLQHTALASDYLRAAREAALGGAMVPVVPRAITPTTPSSENLAARVPAPSSATAPASAPPLTAAPPATAPLSEVAPLPLLQRAAPTAAAYTPEPELLHGPPSIGTQASIAPPLPNPTPAPMPAVQPELHPAFSPLAHAGMAPAPSALRPLAPSAMAGTMLDRAAIIPGSDHGAPPSAPLAPPAAHSASAAFSARFEQVPSARSSLAQQQTGFGLHIPIDQSATDWGRASLDHAHAAPPKDKPRSRVRWMVLTMLAVAGIGVAAFGKPLMRAARSIRSADIEQRSAADEPEIPKQTTLTNLPGTAQPAAAAPVATPPATPAVSVAAAAAPAVPPSVAVEKAGALDPAAARAAEAARKRAEAVASPESKLAAQAARHVLAARYSDALPLYRQLQQSYPENTAYAAMVRVLEQKAVPTAKAAQP